MGPARPGNLRRGLEQGALYCPGIVRPHKGSQGAAPELPAGEIWPVLPGLPLAKFPGRRAVTRAAALFWQELVVPLWEPLWRHLAARLWRCFGKSSWCPSGSRVRARRAPCYHGGSRHNGDGGWGRSLPFPDPPRAVPGRRRMPARPHCTRRRDPPPRRCLRWRGHLVRACLRRACPPPPTPPSSGSPAMAMRAARAASLPRNPATPKRAAPPPQWHVALEKLWWSRRLPFSGPAGFFPAAARPPGNGRRAAAPFGVVAPRERACNIL